MKKIECTGSPKNCGISTKEVFLTALAPFGYEHGKMTKKNNQVDVLACEDKSGNSKKLQLARELGVEIMTYQELKEAFELEGDME